MKRIVYISLMVLMFGIISVGCISMPTPVTDKVDFIDMRVKSIQGDLNFYRGLVGNVVSRLIALEGRVGVIERKLSNIPAQPLSQDKIDIFIAVEQNDTRTSKSCNNIDEAISFINTFR